jgi:N-acetyl-gamma-glutamyl-phosphate reductase
MKTIIKAGIIGGAGYTGGELLRLLLHHPAAQISFIQSTSQAGKPVHSVHTDLAGETDLLFTPDWSADADVLFLCMGHGQSRQWIEHHKPPGHIRIIDLSNDFRLKSPDNAFVYGLPEYNRDAIRSAPHIANPGCFATAIQLSLLPLAQSGALGEINTSGITGSTGAGQALQDSVHFSWRNNNIQAYKTLCHQHTAEIEQTLQHSSPDAALYFVPYRGDFTRGIYSTTYIRTEASCTEAVSQFKAYYASHPFTHVSDTPIDLKQVVNTNKCLLFLEKQRDRLIIHAVIDNLLKGASGQAVQNMNLLFGIDETTGLHLKASAF